MIICHTTMAPHFKTCHYTTLWSTNPIKTASTGNILLLRPQVSVTEGCRWVTEVGVVAVSMSDRLALHGWRGRCMGLALHRQQSGLDCGLSGILLLWPPCVADADIIFLPCSFFVSSIFFFYSSPNRSGRRLDVYHTSTHGVALVRI